jgi:hypothetical protein
MAYSLWLGPTAFVLAVTGMVLWKRVRMADGACQFPPAVRATRDESGS